jgi:hypothetical protein
MWGSMPLCRKFLAGAIEVAVPRLWALAISAD